MTTATTPHPTIRDLIVELYTDPESPHTIAEISRRFGIGREPCEST